MRRSALFITLGFLSASAISPQTQADNSLWSMTLQELIEVELATGTPKPPEDAPAILSVITAEDLALTGARTLAEALERVPGLHVMPSINRLTPLFAIRGIFSDSTPQVLVQIDGVDISELTALSTPYAFHYPIQFVERIEVIRGPGSALHGADAFSGVINVITRRPGEQDLLQAGGRSGSFSHNEAWINGNLARDEWRIGFSLVHEEEGNDEDRLTRYGVLQRDRDMDNLHINIDYGDFSLNNWYWRTRQQMGVGAGIVGNDFDRDIVETVRSQLAWTKNYSQDVALSADVSHTDSRFDASFQLLPPGIWPVGNDGNVFLPDFTPVSFPQGVIGSPSARTQQTLVNTTLVYEGLEAHRIRLGLGARRSRLTDIEESKNFGPGILDIEHRPPDLISDTIVDVSGTPFIYTPSYTRDVWYLSLQDEYRINDTVELTSGIRFDDYSDFGSTINPRLALVWRSTEALTSKLLFGTAFRAPKVAELAFINNPTVLGNPNLEPETIQTVEFAFDYQPSEGFEGRLNLYRYRAEDLIQLDQTFTYQNRGEQQGWGFEAEVAWEISQALNINANLSWLEAELPMTGHDKERVPGTTAYLDVRYRLHDNLVFTAQGYWIADRQREAGDPRPAVSDYLQTDINLLWQPKSEWRVTAGVKNLLDERILEPVPNSPLFAIGLGFPGDYPMQSRRVFASLEYSY